jgi:hypothetical protein
VKDWLQKAQNNAKGKEIVSFGCFLCLFALLAAIKSRIAFPNGLGIVR